MRPRMMMGAAAPAPAKTRTTTETKAPVRQQTRKVEKKREYAPPEEAPRYEVILLDDEEYEEGHIVNNLVRIIPGIESNKAKQVYLETKKVVFWCIFTTGVGLFFMVESCVQISLQKVLDVVNLYASSYIFWLSWSR